MRNDIRLVGAQLRRFGPRLLPEQPQRGPQRLRALGYVGSRGRACLASLLHERRVRQQNQSTNGLQD